MSRRKIIFTWCVYSLAALVLLLLQSALLNRLHLWGVHPFLPPCIAAIVATYSSRRGGVMFGLILGLFCDLVIAGLFPLFYTVTLSICALCSGILSRRFLQPGFACSMAVCAASLLFCSLFQMAVLTANDLSTSGGSFLMVRELLVTMPVSLLVFLIYRRLVRFLSDV